jgi:hypothetical protein
MADVVRFASHSDKNHFVGVIRGLINNYANVDSSTRCSQIERAIERNNFLQELLNFSYKK